MNESNLHLHIIIIILVSIGLYHLYHHQQSLLVQCARFFIVTISDFLSLIFNLHIRSNKWWAYSVKLPTILFIIIFSCLLKNYIQKTCIYLLVPIICFVDCKQLPVSPPMMYKHVNSLIPWRSMGGHPSCRSDFTIYR